MSKQENLVGRDMSNETTKAKLNKATKAKSKPSPAISGDCASGKGEGGHRALGARDDSGDAPMGRNRGGAVGED